MEGGSMTRVRQSWEMEEEGMPRPSMSFITTSTQMRITQSAPTVSSARLQPCEGGGAAGGGAVAAGGAGGGGGVEKEAGGVDRGRGGGGSSSSSVAASPVLRRRRGASLLPLPLLTIPLLPAVAVARVAVAGRVVGKAVAACCVAQGVIVGGGGSWGLHWRDSTRTGCLMTSAPTREPAWGVLQALLLLPLLPPPEPPRVGRGSGVGLGGEAGPSCC